MNNKKKYSYIVLSALALVSILMLMTAAGCSEAGYDNAINTTESPSTTATFGDNTSSVSEQPTQATATQTSTSATITPTQTPATPTQTPATPTQAPATPTQATRILQQKNQSYSRTRPVSIITNSRLSSHITPNIP